MSLAGEAIPRWRAGLRPSLRGAREPARALRQGSVRDTRGGKTDNYNLSLVSSYLVTLICMICN